MKRLRARESLSWLRSGVLLLSGLILAFAGCQAFADTEDVDELRTLPPDTWVPVRHDRLHGIRTFMKQEEGKRLRSFRVEARLGGTIESHLRVLLDFDNYHRWFWEVQDARLLRKSSATVYYLYLKHRAPHGLPGRDAVLQATFEPQTAENRTLVYRVRAVPDVLEEKPPLIRMRAEDMLVQLTPLPGRQVQLVAEGYVDPGGHAPNWAFNYIQRSAPYQTVLGLQRMMQDPEYRERREKLPFPVLGPATP